MAFRRLRAGRGDAAAAAALVEARGERSDLAPEPLLAQGAQVPQGGKEVQQHLLHTLVEVAEDVFNPESEDPGILLDPAVHGPHVRKGVAPVKAVLAAQVQPRLQPASSREQLRSKLELLKGFCIKIFNVLLIFLLGGGCIYRFTLGTSVCELQLPIPIPMQPLDFSPSVSERFWRTFGPEPGGASPLST